MKDVIFEPLSFRNLTVKNRVLRSSVGGMFDNYDGSGTQARINWETKFARGGVGAIISSFVPVDIRGRVVPNFATIHRDESIPFWRRLAESVRRYDCKYIAQLTHSGRQRDIHGIENRHNKPLTSTSGPEFFHGIVGQAMSVEQIRDVVKRFADGARRAREAGLDGVEIHAAHGYLFTQFLSSAINQRKDEYGGSLENRARLLLEVVRAIRRETGDDFHLQVKISATDHGDALYPWKKKGNTLDDTIRVCGWLEEAGVDAIHVSGGSFFPHPLNPPGEFPIDDLARVYGPMLPAGRYALINYIIFKLRFLHPAFHLLWDRKRKGSRVEGIFADDARAIKRNVSVPVLCAGGFQTASHIREVIEQGSCDGVTVARSLVANNDLVRHFERGEERPEQPCTYCNRCLYHIIGNPMGCYDVTRYDGDYEKMMAEILSVYESTSDNWT